MPIPYFANKAKTPHFTNKYVDKMSVFAPIGKMWLWQNVCHTLIKTIEGDYFSCSKKFPLKTSITKDLIF